jgi:hypothetical protein
MTGILTRSKRCGAVNWHKILASILSTLAAVCSCVNALEKALFVIVIKKAILAGEDGFTVTY